MTTNYDYRAINLRSHHIKIRDYDPSQLESLGAQLYAISRSIGILKPFSAEIDLPILIKFLQQQYGYITGDEISYAFELSASGKLTKPLVHFNSFSLVLLGDVLNSYQAYYISQYRLYQQHERTLQEDEHKAEIKSKQIAINEDMAVYERLFTYCSKHSMLPVADLWEKAFKYCEDNKLIVLTIEQKKELFDVMEKQVQNDSLLENRRARSENRVYTTTPASVLAETKNRCYKHLLLIHYSQLLNKPIKEWNEK